MFPITCNAIGDIIAAVQLIRDIAVALDDARGAAEEYKHFVHVLTALGTVMEAVYELANSSQDESLKSVVLEEVRRCCIDINSAHNSIVRFDKLEEASVRPSRGTRRSALLNKLHWHFLKASDAAKYAKRFGESHQRLNTYIGLLSHLSTSQFLEEQRLHLQIVQNQGLMFERSANEIKAVALSSFQNGLAHPRQQIVEQILTRPFFASPQDRRVASRARRVTDMIFDTLASDAPAPQRERFLSLLAPFLVAGAAFVVHNNVGSQWQSTGLWSAICALVVQVLWLQSSTPSYPGFNHGNGLLLTGLFGESITVPYQFCCSFEVFHEFVNLLYARTPGAHEFVPCKLYELYAAGTSHLISPNHWQHCVRPGICFEMALLLPNPLDEDELPICPYCKKEYGDFMGPTCEFVCSACSKSFWQTREDASMGKFAGIFAGASVLATRHNTDFDSALVRMNVPFTASISSYQMCDYEDEEAATSFMRRCHRVRVINVHYLLQAVPDDIRWGSQLVVDTLLSDQKSRWRTSIGFELLRAYIRDIAAINPVDNSYAPSLRDASAIYNAARAELRSTIFRDTYGSVDFGSPMTLVEQLLVNMTSALDAFASEPSVENFRRWEGVVKGYSKKHLSSAEQQEFRGLVKDHRIISKGLPTAFEFS